MVECDKSLWNRRKHNMGVCLKVPAHLNKRFRFNHPLRFSRHISVVAFLTFYFHSSSLFALKHGKTSRGLIRNREKEGNTNVTNYFASLFPKKHLNHTSPAGHPEVAVSPSLPPSIFRFKIYIMVFCKLKCCVFCNF